MNRRELVKLLAVAPWLATLPAGILPPEFVPDVPGVPLEPKRPIGYSIASSFYATGYAPHSRYADVEVWRPNGVKLLSLSLNAYGGYVYWRASPGEELIFPTNEGPVVRCEDPDVRWGIPLHTPDGYMVLLNGHDGPVKLEA